MIIKNAFARTTAKGHKIFRIILDNNEILDNITQGKTLIAIDILTRGGMVKTISGKSKTGKPYDALQYYSWATEKKEEVKEEAVAC
jgi:hypothetical protein